MLRFCTFRGKKAVIYKSNKAFSWNKVILYQGVITHWLYHVKLGVQLDSSGWRILTCIYNDKKPENNFLDNFTCETQTKDEFRTKILILIWINLFHLITILHFRQSKSCNTMKGKTDRLTNKIAWMDRKKYEGTDG